MKGFRHLQRSLGTLALVLVACTTKPEILPPATPPDLVHPEHLSRIAPPSGLARPEESARGDVYLSVRWPSYGIQTVPLAANRLVVEANAPGGTVPLATLELVRPAGTGNLAGLPAGDVAIVVRAWKGSTAKAPFPVCADELGNNCVVAQATVNVKVVANKRVKAAVDLLHLRPPQIASVSILAAFPGAGVRLSGTGFNGFGSATPSLKIGGVSLAGPFPGTSDANLVFVVPEAATAGVIALSTADGLSTQTVQVFTALKSVTITPTVVTVARNAAQLFTVKALDAAGVEVPDVVVPLVALCCPTFDFDVGTNKGIGAGTYIPTSRVYTAPNGARTITLVVGQGTRTATATITVP